MRSTLTQAMAWGVVGQSLHKREQHIEELFACINFHPGGFNGFRRFGGRAMPDLHMNEGHQFHKWRYFDTKGHRNATCRERGG